MLTLEEGEKKLAFVRRSKIAIVTDITQEAKVIL